MNKFYLLIFILWPNLSFAQKKVDLDRFNFKVRFRSLPEQPLDRTYRTYSVNLSFSQAMPTLNKESTAANTVLIEGWKRLNSKAHLLIEVQFDNLLPESVNVQELNTITKNKVGAVTGTQIMYYQKVVYTFAAVAHITDFKGVHINDETLANRSFKQVYNSPQFASKALAQGYFLLNSVRITKELYNNCVIKAMHYLGNKLTDNYGFAEVSSNDYMYVIGSRKHPEYDDNRKAIRQISDVLFSMNANEPITEAHQQLMPAINYFESIKNNYSSNSKHDRKIRYASFFNLAVLYYYLDDPKAMMKEATGLILNDYETSVGKAFQATALRLETEFQKSNIFTRHFSIDANLFNGPDANAVTADVTSQ